MDPRLEEYLRKTYSQEGLEDERQAASQGQFANNLLAAGSVLNKGDTSFYQGLNKQSDSRVNEYLQSLRGQEAGNQKIVEDQIGREDKEANVQANQQFQRTMAEDARSFAAGENQKNRAGQDAMREATLGLKQDANRRANEKAVRDGDKAVAAKEATASSIITAGQTVLRDIGTAIVTIDKWGRGAAGLGSVSSKIPETPANQLKADIESIKGNVAVDQLLKIKRQGAGLGQVPQSQLDMLAGLLGGLRQDMPPDKLKANLQDIAKIYAQIIEAEGGDPFALSRDKPPAPASVGGLTPEEEAELAELERLEAEGGL